MGPAELIVRLVSINVFSKNLRNMSTYFNLATYERLIQR
jgi:hypothetical protein